MRKTRNRREVIAGGAAALAVSKLFRANAQTQERTSIGYAGSKDVFPFGAHIYREPSLSVAQYAHDLPLLKRLGFNMVKVQEVWAANERQPGELELDRILEVLRLTRQHDLLVYFGVTMEVAPAWLWKKYPDARMVLASGQPLVDDTQYVLPEDGKPGPCWYHPGARAAAISFLGRLTRVIAPFENICVWNVWQELGLDPQSAAADPSSISYSSYTLSAFRAWLRTRYRSVEALNTAWKTFFGAWEEVEPPRRFLQVPAYIDWRFFMQDVFLADALVWKADTIRRNDPRHRPVMAHVGRADSIGAADWLYAERVDIFGGSFYPSWGERNSPVDSYAQRSALAAKAAVSMAEIALSCDVLRCAGKGNFWAAELQGGRAPGGLFPGRVPDASDIRRWSMMLLAGGARGICFWNHRDEILWSEALGFGLLDIGSDSTERAAEAGRISQAIQLRASNLLREGNCPRASIAIAVNEDLRSLLVVSPNATRTFETNVKSVHERLWRIGVATDFVRISEVASHPYPILFLLSSQALSDACLAGLTEFVRAGGVLIAEAGTGRLNEFGLARNDAESIALTHLFGAIATSFTTLPVIEAEKKSDSVIFAGTGACKDLAFAASTYLQTFQPQTASTIFQCGTSSVGVCNQFGLGKACLVGTLLGGMEEDTLSEFLRWIAPLKQSELFPSQKLIRRSRNHRGTEAWFFINPYPNEIEETVDLGSYTSAMDLLSGEVLTPREEVGVGRQLALAVEGENVRCILPYPVKGVQ